MGELRYQGHRIRYSDVGEGDQALVLVHGLLMNRRMYKPLASHLAANGHRVISVDLLGHGDSDQPEDLRLYSMPLFARQVVALLDHLELETAIVGGTSLGANVALELAVREPDRLEGLFIEMPVLDNALAAVAGIFTPIMLGLRMGRPAFEVTSRLASVVPRTNFLLDIGLDWVRRRPGPSLAVLEGLLLGETAPHREERQGIGQPALIVGHPRDPLHPFSDSGMLVEELPDARLIEASSILEWRISPRRLTGELTAFLSETWARREAKRSTGSKSNGNGRGGRATVAG